MNKLYKKLTTLLTSLALISGLIFNAAPVYGDTISDNTVTKEEFEISTVISENSIRTGLSEGEEDAAQNPVKEMADFDRDADISGEFIQEKNIEEKDENQSSEEIDAVNEESTSINIPEAIDIDGNITCGEFVPEITEEISEEELIAHQETANILDGQLEMIEELEPDDDYVSDEVFFTAETRAEAEEVAQQYEAELKE